MSAVPASLTLPQRPLLSRRSLLALATAMLFLLGMILLGRMFLASLTPTEATRSAHILEVDLSDLAPGQVRRINWEGNEVLVLHRTPAQIAWLAAPQAPLPPGKQLALARLPPALRNPFRSFTPSYLVVSVWLSRGQTVLRELGENGTEYDMLHCDDFQTIPAQLIVPGANGEDVTLPGGFFCPRYEDNRGQVYLAYDPAGNSTRRYIAPLEIPPHRFAGKHLILDRTWGQPEAQP